MINIKKYKYSLIIFIISLVFFTLSGLYLSEGCYKKTGYCQNFIKTKVNVKKVNNKNKELIGEYYKNEKGKELLYECEIHKTESDNLKNNLEYMMYYSKDEPDECYTFSKINQNGKVGLFFLVIGIIFFIIPFGTTLILRIIENNKDAECSNENFNIQLNSKFKNNFTYEKIPENEI